MHQTRVLYLDETEAERCVSVFVRDAKVIPAGTTISAMSVRDKCAEYERYGKEYDIHFIFDDDVPQVDFYTIPQVDIVAADSRGGFIGMVGQYFSLESNAPVCYIDRNRKCYLIAKSGREFLDKVSSWKKDLKAYEGVVFFKSKEDAERAREFIDRRQIEV